MEAGSPPRSTTWDMLVLSGKRTCKISFSQVGRFQIRWIAHCWSVRNLRSEKFQERFEENPFNFSITGIGVRTYIDTDGDNVTDNFDLDDDNDGME